MPPSGVQSEAPSIPSGGKTVALTFDDGPGASTAAILSILESYGVRATFFNIGEQEAAWPQDVRAEAAAGFLIGNHTWNHPDMTTLSAAGQAAEMDEVIAEQQALVGSSPCVFRPPYGDYNSTTLELAAERHMAVWLWNVDTEDWEAEGSGSSYWVNRIISLAESEGGALDHPVVLMHNQGIPMPATVAALPTIIQFFESHGYTFVDLLGRTGPPGSCGTASASAPRPSATDLRPGEELASGASMESPGRQYRLVMQDDGNLVLYDSAGRPLWASGTRGNPGDWAIMQKDGNFVIYSKSGRPLWSTGTAHHPGAFFAEQSDANLVVYGSSGALWASGSVDSQLAPGESLEPGWYLESPDRLCHFVMQGDGNLVLYAANNRPLWASNTRGVSGASVVMQLDGNLVVYSATWKAAWASGTEHHPGAFLDVGNDAQVVVESPSGVTLWSTG